MKLMKKRGQAGIITGILLILLVIIAIFIVWGIVKSSVEKSSEGISTSYERVQLSDSLEVRSWAKNPDETTVNVTVKRGTIEGDMKGITYTVKTNETGCYIETNNTLQPLETKIFIINISECSGNIEDILVYFLLNPPGDTPSLPPEPNLPQTGIGIEGMKNFDELPYFKDNIQTLQFSSFDRSGGNADGSTSRNSWIYMDNGEYVIFDETGPGTVYNIWMAGKNNWGFLDEVNGRIKFYFDDKQIPDINENLGDFFKPTLSPPFLAPLTGSKGWTRYSLLPIQFKTRLKISMYNTTNPLPRYYHVTYQKYPTNVNLDSYSGTEDISQISSMWNNKGNHPTGNEGTTISTGTTNINSGTTQTLVDYSGTNYNYISSIKIRPDASAINDLWIKISFDGTQTVYAPIGEFFGSGIGEYNLSSLAFGMSTTGDYYGYFPMPFLNNVKIQIENKGASAYSLSYTIKAKKDSNMVVGTNAGYFYAKYNKEYPTVLNKDYNFLNLTGRGHFVGVTHTMRGTINTNNDNLTLDGVCYLNWEGYWYLEGDERFFIDGKLSPNLHGTGTEDYYDGAFYFKSAEPYFQAIFGVQNKTINLYHSYSAYRLHINDVIPFTNSADFGIEHGGTDDTASNYSSVAFYYAINNPSTTLTDSLDIGDSASETSHSYSIINGNNIPSSTFRYPGHNNNLPKIISDNGKNFTNGQSSFKVSINSNNNGVILRRRLDYSLANQIADVYVDNQLVGKWYTAGMHDNYNPASLIKWLDSDFHIPESFTSGKTSITVNISSSSWNEFYYWVYSKKL